MSLQTRERLITSKLYSWIKERRHSNSCFEEVYEKLQSEMELANKELSVQYLINLGSTLKKAQAYIQAEGLELRDKSLKDFIDSFASDVMVAETWG